MSDYVLITDSTADLPFDLANELEIEIVKMGFSIDGKNYLDGDISAKEFYGKLREKVAATTSQINPEKFMEVFSGYLEQGKDILCVSLSSGISGTYNSAKIAAEELSGKYPDRKIKVIDSMCASLGEGLLVYYMANKKKNGVSLDELVAWAEENKLKVCHWFTVDDLYHLKRGGRISSTAAVFGSMLGIKPVMHVSDEGKLAPVDKARGRQKSIDSLISKIGEIGIDLENQVIFISQADCEDEVNKMVQSIKNQFKVKDVIVGNIGSVIGSHAGAGTIALFFMGTKR